MGSEMCIRDRSITFGENSSLMQNWNGQDSLKFDIKYKGFYDSPFNDNYYFIDGAFTDKPQNAALLGSSDKEDSFKFSIDQNGLLTSYDYIDYNDFGAIGGSTNEYEIWVKATDANNNHSIIHLDLNVLDYSPTITGPGGNKTKGKEAGLSTNTVSIQENTTTVYTFTADENVTWDLYTPYGGFPYDNESVDVSKFSIDAQTGALTFKSAPDYENPTDAVDGVNTGTNDYVVVIEATDTAGNKSVQPLKVNVQDVDEIAPTITGPGGQTTQGINNSPFVFELDTKYTKNILQLQANEDVTWELMLSLIHI